jgi:sugar lactone lactonase YvrE
MFVTPHSIYVAPDGNIWVTDGAGPDGKDPNRNGKGHQVFKFSPEGKLLMTLGKAGVAGAGNDEFNAPSSVVVNANGDIFVADGHGGTTNARVIKFSRDGKFIKTWGEAGAGPGQFNPPHSITMDSAGRLYVADRSNNRIQIFDQEGKLLDEWKQFGRPSGVYIKNDILYVGDSQSNEKNNPGFKMGIYIGSVKDGKVTAFIPDPNPEGSGEEMIVVDNAGTMYGGQVSGRAVTKYVKK